MISRSTSRSAGKSGDTGIKCPHCSGTQWVFRASTFEVLDTQAGRVVGQGTLCAEPECAECGRKATSRNVRRHKMGLLPQIYEMWAGLRLQEDLFDGNVKVGQAVVADREVTGVSI